MALVLAREAKQAIVITAPTGERIEIFIHQIVANHKVKLAINAPREFAVHRMEVQEAIDKEQVKCQQATKNTSPAALTSPSGLAITPDPASYPSPAK